MSGADERDGDQDDHDEMLVKDVREDEVHEGGWCRWSGAW